MKTKRTASIIFSLSLLLLTAGGIEAQSYRLIADSVHIFSFNRELNTMDLNGVNYNYYTSGQLDSSYTADRTRTITAKALYNYSGGVMTEALSFVVLSGTMVPNQKRVFTHDGMNLVTTSLVTRWQADHWQNLNRFTYTYDVNNRLVVYSREFWRVDAWTDFSADSLFYDESGRLIEQSARSKSTGQYITRNLIQYNLAGKKVFQTRQDFLNNIWTNVTRVRYIYNKCGTQISTSTDRWVNGSWQTESGTESFISIEILPGARKVPVCHNGTTIFVHVTQLAAHLAHGDCLGQCVDPGPVIDGETETVSLKSKSLPFIVYPNPARESVSIRMIDRDCPATRIELLDYYGRVMQVINPDSQELTTIDLTALKSGNYILRLTSDAVYSTVITKR